MRNNNSLLQAREAIIVYMSDDEKQYCHSDCKKISKYVKVLEFFCQAMVLVGGDKYQSIKGIVHASHNVILGMQDFNVHVDRNIDGFQGVHGGFSIGKRHLEGRMLSEFSDAKHLCINNTWFGKADKKKITYDSGCNKSEIDFFIIGKVDGKFCKKYHSDHRGVAA